jgi:hypothetical protein
MVAGLALTIALPAPAQMRNINLTGAPIKAITEPFTVIAGVRELPGNKVVVVDRQEKKVMMANFVTGSVTPIGRNGSGPGEYEYPVSLFAGPGTDTWVGDPQAGKIHVVKGDGKVVDGILPPEGEGGMSLLVPRAVDVTGRLYYQSFPRAEPGKTPNADSMSILRWDRVAKRIDTLGKVPSGMSVNTSGSSGNNMRVMISSKPLAAVPVWTALPDGRVVIVQPSPYRVDVLGTNKSVSRGPVQAYTPIKMTAAERNAYRTALKSSSPIGITRTSGGPGGGTNVSTTAQGPAAREIPDEDFPAVMPPFSGLNSVQISPDGEIWVLRTRPASDKIPTYDIFNSAGQLTGKATLKPNSTVVGFGAGAVYVARQDPEDDLRYLEKYAR